MSPRVLIVDDAAFMRLLVRKALLAAGFEIAGEAANGVEAVRMYAELKPDLVTVDMVMPEMDGIEAIRRIRAMDSKAKIIVVSAVNQRENLLEAIRLGAADYIVKPFDAERVVSAVRRALNLQTAAAGASA